MLYSKINSLQKGGISKLKSLVKILLLLAVIFVIGIYFNIGDSEKENAVLLGEKSTAPEKQGEDLPMKSSLPGKSTVKPAGGLGLIIGKSSDEVIKTYGKPTRVDFSSYGYHWWIYGAEEDSYMQIAIKSGKAVSAYAIGDNVNVSPFKIGQPVDEIYKNIEIETFIDIETKDSSYRFELSEPDMNMRPLIKMDQVYAQLYLDKFTGTVSSVRFLNEATLIEQQPYELTYRGHLPKEPELTEEQWVQVEAGNRQQIFDITNVMRKRFDLSPLKWDDPVSEVAFMHSSEMYKDKYFSHTSPTKGDLAERLKGARISYMVAGENIAAHYVDAVAAMEGWLNSKGHREALLNEEFTHLGVGVYKKYYTQNFIAK
ncbi:hypothetical protein D0469_04195 [Peribacillus saganii]|uniref:CAP domain-containing protein n=1 Tax=Peribacillus saganii TaxID=2303992 RepID=A0A372LSL4_9BACI|nr:hypothetical protein D0469_04195 [Peribacillus saganii]